MSTMAAPATPPTITISTMSVSTKPCVAKGHRECVRGFHRDRCRDCTKGSVPCRICKGDFAKSSSSPCTHCVEGRSPCGECYGLGYVQRICRDCVHDHYRRQSPTSSGTVVTKVKGQLMVAQHQFSRSMTSLASSLQHVTSKTDQPSNSGNGQDSDSDDSTTTARSMTDEISSNNSGNSRTHSISSLRYAASKVVKVTTSVLGGHKNSSKRRSSGDECGTRTSSSSGGNVHQRKSSWSSSNSAPSAIFA
ncbi:hypothetical protein B0O80DRAFT_440445 [Mortierella sp. GBAus27b]|nr:hypothetical protein BGX31_007821 [Mortierella sp. GBA43]KAI8359520.1 hypothetical protein B0O80DRAFT_440445 [Mortierella sp. GBAus27b]